MRPAPARSGRRPLQGVRRSAEHSRRRGLIFPLFLSRPSSGAGKIFDTVHGMILLRTCSAAGSLAASPSSPPHDHRPRAGGRSRTLALEAVESPDSLAWAKAQNAKTLPVLQGDARYAGLEARPWRSCQRQGPRAGVSFAGDGSCATSGRTPTTCAASGARPPGELPHGRPRWETILDIDALSKAEGANWVFKGATASRPKTHPLPGDPVERRQGRRDGPRVRHWRPRPSCPAASCCPRASRTIEWLDKDTLLVARNGARRADQVRLRLCDEDAEARPGPGPGGRGLSRPETDVSAAAVRAARQRRQGRGGAGQPPRDLLRDETYLLGPQGGR
jgi:hypothetical protein